MQGVTDRFSNKTIKSWKIKPTMGQCLDEKLTRFERQNVLCVLRTHASSLRVKNGDFY
ncbi:hypothetical protein HPSNT_07630 [Helicobacter pylori SNT49]|uniref:Uncharacterized protein n=1 Tax=Helicobacter pylori SNT49 TaxID=1055530 RepID=G2MCM8_HELPX|nr:hypothetical protein HPSNT_07630 [Helicobacter pylori SNT49]